MENAFSARPESSPGRLQPTRNWTPATISSRLRAWLSVLLGTTTLLPSVGWSRPERDYELAFGQELPCAIVESVRRQGGADPYAWFRARRAEARSQFERYVAVFPKADDAEAVKTYDLRWPLLGRVMFWFFSSEEYTLPFAVHRIAPAPARPNLWLALVRLQEEYKGRTPAPDLVNDPARAELVAQKALGDDLLQLPSLPLPEGYGELRFESEVMMSFMHRASALTETLLPMPRRSLSHLRLWEIALNASDGDPFGALGTISATLFMEAGATPRRRLAVLNERLAPLYRIPTSDHVGPNYHFWNYLTRALVYPNDTLRQRLLSFAYERVNQGDLEDYHADQAGVRVAQGIERALAFNSNVCRESGEGSGARPGSRPRR